MNDQKKQQKNFNWRFGEDVFVHRVPTPMHMARAPSNPAIIETMIAEYSDFCGPIDNTWIGLTYADFFQLQQIAKAMPTGKLLGYGTAAALDMLDIPYHRDPHSEEWRLHSDYCLAIFPHGTKGVAELANAQTPLDTNPLSVALVTGAGKARLATARREWESIKRRRRGEAEARMEREWGEACRIAGEAEEAAEAAR